MCQEKAGRDGWSMAYLDSSIMVPKIIICFDTTFEFSYTFIIKVKRIIWR
jgi:hypothetical protein